MSHSGSSHDTPSEPTRSIPHSEPVTGTAWKDVRAPVTRTVPNIVPPRAERTDVDPPRAARTDQRTSVLRVPTFSVIAPILGWILAWGAVVIATTILQRANVNTGFGLGIATGGTGNNGFWAGLRLLIVTGGAFLLGGYTAARVARAHGTLHGILVWVIAMLATAADTLVETIRTGTVSVIRLIPGIPYWAGTELGGRGDPILVYAPFAAAALVGALIGGLLGQTANRVDRTDDAVLITTT